MQGPYTGVEEIPTRIYLVMCTNPACGNRSVPIEVEAPEEDEPLIVCGGITGPEESCGQQLTPTPVY